MSSTTPRVSQDTLRITRKKRLQPIYRSSKFTIFEEQVKIYNALRLKKHSKHLTVFFPETVNIKKMANITANTKKYGQITLNTKPHSYPLKTTSGNWMSIKCVFDEVSEHAKLVRHAHFFRAFCKKKIHTITNHAFCSFSDNLLNRRFERIANPDQPMNGGQHWPFPSTSATF